MAVPKIRAEVHGHLDLDDMQEGLDRLRLARTVPERDRLAADLLLDPGSPEEGAHANRLAGLHPRSRPGPLSFSDAVA